VDIVIPTYGRANKQETAGHLDQAGVPYKLVVQHRESHLYVGRPIVILPDHIRTIAPTRQYIVDNVGTSDTLCMLDDDLVFFKRRTDDRTKLRDITPPELAAMFTDMEFQLNYYPHVGIAAREGANRNTDSYLYNTRIMRVLAYSRDVLRAVGVRFDEMEVMEDFHVALKLLTYGYPNLIMNEYANNQAGSGVEGGCSHFRTPELHAANAKKLAAMYTKFVTVVDKETKGAWGGGTRKDVRIQWKKAYEYGQA